MIALLAASGYQAARQKAYVDSIWAAGGSVKFGGDPMTISRSDIEAAPQPLSLKPYFAQVEAASVYARPDPELIANLDRLTGAKRLYLSAQDGSDLGAILNLTSLEELDLSVEADPDAAMAFVAQLTNLKTLTIHSEQPLNDAGLAHLAALSSLTTLQVDRAQTTPAGLKSLSPLPLRTLRINNQDSRLSAPRALP